MEDKNRKKRYSTNERVLSSLKKELRQTRIMKWVLAGSLAALFLFICIFFWLILFHNPAENWRNATDSEPWSWDKVLVSQQTGGRLLGEYISREYPDGRLLILSSPEKYKSDVEEATLKGLLEGLGERNEKVRIEQVPQNRQDSSQAGFFNFSAESFDKATLPYPDMDIVVSIIGLPYDPQEMLFWQAKPRPELILINAEVFLLSELIRGGGISAVMVYFPYKFKPEEISEPDSEKPWLIITPENLEGIEKRHPNLFASGKSKNE